MTFLTLSSRLQKRIDELAFNLENEAKAKHWHCVAELALELCETQARLDTLRDLDLE